METNRVQSSPKMNGVGESVFVVEVDKSSGSLGLTLEGGTDTEDDVKIKSVKVRLIYAFGNAILRTFFERFGV